MLSTTSSDGETAVWQVAVVLVLPRARQGAEQFIFVVGNAWWYEDFPNLDLGLMKEGFEFDGAE